MKVAVVGASNNPERFSFKAMKLLAKHGHEVIPVTPRAPMIEGLKAYRTLDDLPGPVDTITMYVNAEVSEKFQSAILKLKPRRVIFNPGAENAPLAMACEAAGIDAIEDCTLVMLNSGSF